MMVYKELNEAITETITIIKESIAFKAQFSQLIMKTYDNSCSDAEINALIEDVEFLEGSDNGD